MPDLTAQFQQRIVWDRGALQPVTTRIEYAPMAKDGAAPLPAANPLADARRTEN